MNPTAPNSNDDKTQPEDKAAQPPAPAPDQTAQPTETPEKSEQPASPPAESKPEPTPQQPDQTIQAAKPEQPPPPDDQPPIPPQLEKLYTKNHLMLPIILIVLVIFCVTIFSLLLENGKSNKNAVTATTPTPAATKKGVQPTPVANKTQTLVYGTWTSQSSVVRAVNLGTGTVKDVVSLPLTIKKITVLSPNTLLYIDQTDKNDHGARISVYNMQQKQITINIPADNGYGIDDYVLSPDKRYLAIWEVQFSPGTNMLLGGASRVYAVDLNTPTVTNLLFDESTLMQNTENTPLPIHYPRAILDNGTVLTDQFIPNDPKGGTGWAYGMSKVDFDGTNKQDISSMTNGTYGSQPTLSPDGKFMLFEGYDESNGDGTAVKNGYRQALLTPNTVELLDTTTFNRYKLPNLPPANTYADAQWDKQTGNVIISILSKKTQQMGVYWYDLGKLQYTQIPLPLANSTQYGYISQLNGNKTLIGIQSTDPSNLGNLGDTYAYAYTQIATIDTKGKLNPLTLGDPFMQYITLLPGDYFQKVLAAQTSQTTPQPGVTYAVLQGTDANPQNYNFFLKTTLASLRIQGKSNPGGSTTACQNLGNTRCAALGFKQNSAGYTVCQNIEKANNRTANACY